MRTLIAIPAMEQIFTVTAQCLMNLRTVDEVFTQFAVRMPVDVARNTLAKYALENEFDRILWIDSDMTFNGDLMERLSADIDEGYDLVCGLFFKRKFPVEPVISKRLQEMPPESEPYLDYPRDTLFPIAGCGFGAVMMRTEILRDLDEPPFSMIHGMSEDYSFCNRIAKRGRKMACDSRIKVGHVGLSVFSEKLYKHPDESGGGDGII